PDIIEDNSKLHDTHSVSRTRGLLNLKIRILAWPARPFPIRITVVRRTINDSIVRPAGALVELEPICPGRKRHRQWKFISDLSGPGKPAQRNGSAARDLISDRSGIIRAQREETLV